MSRIARSEQPLYQTRDRPVSWHVTMTNPDGSPLDLTGATAVARLTWASATRLLAGNIPVGTDGRIVLTGDASVAADIPLGRVNELWLTLTDSQGGVTDYVWPVIGEVP